MSRGPLGPVNDFLRGEGAFAPAAPARGRWLRLSAYTLLFGALYGAAMGSFGVCATGQPRLWAYVGLSALKAPALLLVTFLLCVPFYFVINTLAGLRDDFAEALRAIVGTLAGLAVAIASLSPLTLFFYACTTYYDAAILFNGAMFFLGSLAAVCMVVRYYVPLIRRSARHALMLGAWFFAYIFVAIQMAWTLRPFVGDPNPAVLLVILRGGEFDNAYVEVIRLFGQVWRAWAP